MADDRYEVLRDRAPAFAGTALTTIRQEFPNDLGMVMRRPGDYPYRPKAVHPAFYGSFDWHSCIEMHWVLARLLRTMPEASPDLDIRAALNEHLTAPALATETATFASRAGLARPYGWSWALTLIHELGTWDDEDGQRWAANAAQFGTAITAKFLRWLPKATYPVRQGAHYNYAFGLSRALDYARWRADQDEPDLLAALTEAAHRWFGDDADYPGDWEPDGTDFLSPALCEAELMANVLPAAEFVPWLDRFLPGLADREPASLFTPAVVSDDHDGLIAHLHGLNLSRAWCCLRLADALPADDPRVPVLRENARTHAEPELDHVSGAEYTVEHWLACYALLYLSA
jgi:hypothetical protein